MTEPNLKGLRNEHRRLREYLLREAAAAARFDLDDATLSKARAAVDGVLAKFFFASNEEAMREHAANHGGSRKIIDLLRMASMAELATFAPPELAKVRYFKGQPQRQRPDLRVIENTISGPAE
jgi:hypothetical protein